MELIQKGEVAWLNASDAPKDKDISSARRGGRPPAAWKNNDDYDDEPSTSKGPGALPLIFASAEVIPGCLCWM